MYVHVTLFLRTYMYWYVLAFVSRKAFLDLTPLELFNKHYALYFRYIYWNNEESM